MIGSSSFAYCYNPVNVAVSFCPKVLTLSSFHIICTIYLNMCLKCLVLIKRNIKEHEEENKDLNTKEDRCEILNVNMNC